MKSFIIGAMLFLLFGLGLSLFFLTRPPSDIQTVCTGCCDEPELPPYILIDTNDPADIYRIAASVNGQIMIFTLVDGVWKTFCGVDVMCEVDQTIPQIMLNAVREVQVSSLLVEDFDFDNHILMAEFGLDEPTHSIILVNHDLSGAGYFFGALNRHERAYYFAWSGSDNLYLVAQDLAWKILQFFDVDVEFAA